VPNQEHIGDFAILIAVSFEHAAHTPSAVEDEGGCKGCAGLSSRAATITKGAN
jgi:hypothetical protein